MHIIIIRRNKTRCQIIRQDRNKDAILKTSPGLYVPRRLSFILFPSIIFFRSIFLFRSVCLLFHLFLFPGSGVPGFDSVDSPKEYIKQNAKIIAYYFIIAYICINSKTGHKKTIFLNFYISC